MPRCRVSDDVDRHHGPSYVCCNNSVTKPESNVAASMFGSPQNVTMEFSLGGDNAE